MDFKLPVKNRKSLNYRPKGGAATSRKKTSVKFKVVVPKDKYTKLFHKAKRECPTAAPVHDVMELLLQYYVENRFVIHRRMVLVEDETVTDEIREIRKKRHFRIIKSNIKEPIELWMQTTQYENDRLSYKIKKDGVSKNYIMNLLIDYYLKNKFLIKTTIIRVNRYRTGNPKKDIKIFANRKRERRYIEKHHENLV